MTRGFAAIGLVGTRKESNIGGALRAAHCYDAALIVLQAPRFYNDPENTPETQRHKPVIVGNVLDHVPYDCTLVAVEVTGTILLPKFTHPERAMYVFGPENGWVPDQILKQAQFVVRIPTKQSMNLAATVNVVLYDRMAKYMNKWL